MRKFLEVYMQVSVESLEGLSRKVTITVPEETVTAKYKQRLQKVAQTAKLDGFRPGKIPVKLIETRFGPGILQEIVGELLEESFKSAIQSEGLKIAGQPEVEPLAELKKGEAFTFTVIYETFPEIELALPEGQSVEIETAVISDADVTAMIEKLRKQQSEWILADRPAQNGDRVEMDFEGFMDGKAFEGGKASAFTLDLGSKQMIPGFEDGLLACQIGDETTLNVSFPDDYHVKELAGKPAEFKVKVNKVHMPEMISDDEKLAEKMNVEGGAAKLQEESKMNMERELKRALETGRKNKIFEKLLEANDIHVPQALVDDEIVNLQKMALQQMGGPEAVKQFDKINLPKEPYEKDAQKRVKLGLLLSEVVKKFDIKVDDDRVSEHLKEVASMYPDADKVTSWYRQNPQMLAEIESAIVEEMVAEKLLESMTVTEKTVAYDDIVNPSAAQE
jgi:trigger factor